MYKSVACLKMLFVLLFDCEVMSHKLQIITNNYHRKIEKSQANINIVTTLPAIPHANGSKNAPLRCILVNDATTTTSCAYHTILPYRKSSASASASASASSATKTATATTTKLPSVIFEFE